MRTRYENFKTYRQWRAKNKGKPGSKLGKRLLRRTLENLFKKARRGVISKRRKAA